MKLSITVPCHNEGAVLHQLLNKFMNVLHKLPIIEYEIIVVNDGSTDNTLDVIKQLVTSNNKVIGVNLSRNFGHQYALSAGLSLCTGDRILIIDADLQDPPELLPDMMQLMDEESADVVYGKRIFRESETFFKKATSHIFYRLLSKLADVEIPNDSGDFRLITKRVNDQLLKMPEKQRFIRGMIAWLGFKQVPIDYIRDKRYAGVTKYTFRKMAKLAVDGITSFSISPLKAAIVFAFFFSFISIILMGYVIFSWLYLNAVPGWASIAFIVSLLGSVQLFTLAVMSAYIGRIYTEEKNRPTYIIEEIITSK